MHGGIKMAEIVVLGAGLGGVLLTYELLPRLQPDDRLTLVAEEPRYYFVPSSPWVAVTWRDRGALRRMSVT